MNILNFSTFVFDLDGVIIDSEYTHFDCYAKSLKSNNNYDLDWNTYCKIHHSPNNSFKSVFPDFDKIYSDKNEMYKTEIQNIELKK
jgi:beta-phosphoglucomutase-like phosphatase (HAD superfamily)